jgi:hypothetical protein
MSANQFESQTTEFNQRLVLGKRKRASDESESDQVENRADAPELKRPRLEVRLQFVPFAFRASLTVSKAVDNKKANDVEKKTSFPFLKLPPEIRNMIYGLVLKDPGGIHLTNRSEAGRRKVTREHPWESRYWYPGALEPYVPFEYWKNPRRVLTPAILATNRQIYDEARGVLYSQNQFFMADPCQQVCRTFIDSIAPLAASSLRRVTIVTGWGSVNRHECEGMFTSLPRATELEELKLIDFLSWQESSPVDFARQLYRESRKWLKAVGDSRGKLDAAVDILFVPPVTSLYGPPDDPQSLAAVQKMEEFKDELRRLLNSQHGGN